MQLDFSLPDGTKLLLRTPSENVAQSLFEAASASHTSLGKWMPWYHENYSLADTEAWIRTTVAAADEHSFIIIDPATELCLGTCGLNSINDRHRFANLGYWVRASHNGRGIASSATLRVAAFAFAELELVRVEIVAAVENYASQRVAEKVGATREGVIRNGIMHRHEPLDAVLYSLIPSDLAM